MAPVRKQRSTIAATVSGLLMGPSARKIGTSQNNTNNNRMEQMPLRSTQKRKHEENLNEENLKKRAAFGDLTNAIGKSRITETKKPITKIVIKKGKLSTKSDTVIAKQKLVKIPEGTELSSTESVSSSQETDSGQSSQGSSSQETTTSALSSQEACSQESSLYVTASEESLSTSVFIEKSEKKLKPSVEPVPDGVENFDGEHLHDPFQFSLYARPIFDYYKEREGKFRVKKYLHHQYDISRSMRAILVDWIVEVQESFELNHETLYLAVKIIDLYLMKNPVEKDLLQLVGAAAIFVASKIDERSPPLVDDFLYICDDAYDRAEFLQMERNILTSVDFQLGMPLSYRFLRRYGRCARAGMDLLTLARYILELSLLEYDFIEVSESLIAAAALLLALKMKKFGGWTKTLEYYSGYKVDDLKDMVKRLNTMLHQPPKDPLKTIRRKYLHPVFFEVARTPLLGEVQL